MRILSSIAATLVVLAVPALSGLADAAGTATGAIPACAPGDAVVWENARSKVYHLSGDAYYGKTKHGAYACLSAATAAGYHAVGGGTAHRTRTGPGLTATSPVPATSVDGAPDATATGTPTRHHRRHRGTASAPGGPATSAPQPSET